MADSPAWQRWVDAIEGRVHRDAPGIDYERFLRRFGGPDVMAARERATRTALKRQNRRRLRKSGRALPTRTKLRRHLRRHRGAARLQLLMWQRSAALVKLDLAALAGHVAKSPDGRR